MRINEQAITTQDLTTFIIEPGLKSIFVAKLIVDKNMLFIPHSLLFLKLGINLSDLLV
jgi:hypothetical protein